MPAGEEKSEQSRRLHWVRVCSCVCKAQGQEDWQLRSVLKKQVLVV